MKITIEIDTEKDSPKEVKAKLEALMPQPKVTTLGEMMHPGYQPEYEWRGYATL